MKKFSTQEKIIPFNRIGAVVQRLKRQGKKIVTFNGSFDIVHAGHIHSIEEAKRQGDALIMGINSDASVQIYKGPKRPIIHQVARAELLAALEAVDYVVIFDEINPKRLLETIKPDVHCIGDDWGKNCIERDVVEQNGGKIYILKKEQSSSHIIEKIRIAYSEPQVKAVFLDRDGTISENGRGYTHRIEDFKFLPGVIPALKRLSKTDFKIIVVTNQSGIGRGYYTEADIQKLHKWMSEACAKKGVRIDRIYHCPHVAEDNCDCRKPKIEMFLQAVRDFGISLNDSWFIGDDERDVIAGREANIKVIKLGNIMPKKMKLEPHFYARTIVEAVDILLGKKQ